MLFVAVVLLFFSLPSVFAQTYGLEFQQVYDKVVVKEKIGDNNYSYLEVLSLDNSDSHYFFTYKYNFPNNYTGADVIFLVDSGFVANEIFPQGYFVDGNEIRWNVSVERPFAIFLNLEKKTNYVWVWIVLLVAILALVSFKFREKKVSGKISGVKKKKIDYTFLLDEERKIIEMLKKAKRNEMWQNQIQKQGEFSKAKTSRLIRNLESRGLVKKIPFGNTNKIVLK